MRRFDKKLFLYLLCGFIVFTIVGTVTHELGHYTVARLLGYKAMIHYNFTSYDFTEKNASANLHDSMLITSGGILQTLLTATAGCLLLLFYRQHLYAATRLSVNQWLMILLSLFWLRVLFNFIAVLAVYILRDTMPVSGDEIKLALLLGWSTWSILPLLAFIALLILAAVTFRLVPLSQRFTFMLSGLLGGALGFYLWMEILGPAILP